MCVCVYITSLKLFNLCTFHVVGCCCCFFFVSFPTLSSPSLSRLLLQLPKSSDTSALSGAGFMRLVKNVGDSISKIAGKKADSDSVGSCVCMYRCVHYIHAYIHIYIYVHTYIHTYVHTYIHIYMLTLTSPILLL